MRRKALSLAKNLVIALICGIGGIYLYTYAIAWWAMIPMPQWYFEAIANGAIQGQFRLFLHETSKALVIAATFAIPGYAIGRYVNAFSLLAMVASVLYLSLALNNAAAITVTVEEGSAASFKFMGINWLAYSQEVAAIALVPMLTFWFGRKARITSSSSGPQTPRSFLRMPSALLRKRPATFGAAEHGR